MTAMTQTQTFLNQRIIRNCGPIWEHIKKHGHCKIAVDPSQAQSIVKSVINKKNRDYVWSLQLAEENKRSHLKIENQHNKILIFTLVISEGTRLRSKVL